MIGTAEIAKRLNICPQRVYQLIANGTIKAQQGRYRVYSVTPEEMARLEALERRSGRPRKENPCNT